MSDAVRPRRAGFDFAVISDHYFPWLDEQGHSPYAWSVLGAAAQATERIPLMTYVTCPTIRYHPAFVAQKAATLQLLSDGRFTLGLGAGENLNEHIVGGGWPPADVRQEMLVEAIEIIRALFDGGYVNFRGRALRRRVRQALGPARRARCRSASPSPARSPGARRRRRRDDRRRAGGRAGRDVRRGRRRGQAAGRPGAGRASTTDKAAAVNRAHKQFRWFGGGWKVNAELPGPPAFDAASQFVREEDVDERSRAGTTSTRWSRRCASTSTPGSPTWPWCRSAARPRTSSSTGPKRNCCRALREIVGPARLLGTADQVGHHGRLKVAAGLERAPLLDRPVAPGKQPLERRPPTRSRSPASSSASAVCPPARRPPARGRSLPTLGVRPAGRSRRTGMRARSRRGAGRCARRPAVRRASCPQRW